MKYYLGIDCETGGIGVDKSLLTAFFMVLNERFELLGELSLQIKPNDDIYHVTAEGLTVNGIILPEHDKVAITEKAAGSVLYNFLQQHSDNGKIKLIPLGHGVASDIKFLQAHLISKGSWDKFVSYRTRDTAALGGSLLDAGLIPSTVTGSLTSFCQYFGITLTNAHSADADTRATVKVYEKMLELLKGRAT